MMKINHIVLGIAPVALIGLLTTTAMAQTHPGSVTSRLHNQQKRIRQGVASGQLTRREAERLRLRDSRIHSQQIRARLSGGHISSAERRRLERELNHSSTGIYRQKHDAQHRY